MRSKKDIEDCAALITTIGGTTKVAMLCSQRLKRRITKSVVSMWKRNGIPAFYRPAIRALARQRGARVPINFIPGEDVNDASEFSSIEEYLERFPPESVTDDDFAWAEKWIRENPEGSNDA